MNKRTVSEIMLTMVLVATLMLAFNIQPAKASATIYIRPDGSIDPPTAPIHRDGELYTLTGNITSDSDGIVIERNNMTLDGAGYTLQGSGSGEGFALYGVNNVTIRDSNIKNFHYGVHLYSSFDNFLLDNAVAGNNIGIYLWSMANTLSSNIVTNNDYGIYLYWSSGNTLQANTITDNDKGIQLHYSSDNVISHNNLDNTFQVRTYESYNNNWDDGYPSGGNYWSDYNGTDLCFGPYQNILSSDGIGDTPYVIDVENQDNYPLMKPYVPGNLTVSIYTDKYTYHTGETMHLGVDVANLECVRFVCGQIWLELPDGSTHPYIHRHSFVTPIGWEYTNSSYRTFTLPSPPSGTYTWHVAFLERATHTIIVEDTAEWEFS